MKNLCCGKGDLNNDNTSEFRRGASFQEVCVHMNEVPGEWIKHKWLGDVMGRIRLQCCGDALAYICMFTMFDVIASLWLIAPPF
eukprot:3984703-Karenia_brevis.AAC.1